MPVMTIIAFARIQTHEALLKSTIYHTCRLCCRIFFYLILMNKWKWKYFILFATILTFYKTNIQSSQHTQ